MTQRLQQFLTMTGVVFLFVACLRFYLLLSAGRSDPFFVRHGFVNLLSLLVAGAILRVGRSKAPVTRRSAISLIRSGSVLATVWGFRLILILRSQRSPLELKASLYLALFYVVSGTVVMLVGLRLSRRLHHLSLTRPISLQSH